MEQVRACVKQEYKHYPVQAEMINMLFENKTKQQTFHFCQIKSKIF